MDAQSKPAYRNGIFKRFVVSRVSAVALAYLTEEVHISVVALAINMYLSGNTIGGMSGRIRMAKCSSHHWNRKSDIRSCFLEAIPEIKVL
ncbi:hypothetical protein [Chryseobacterium antibioticum]|uniref:hypothetical protein n=1 Tax=Chryseobacterium antibioticum TaxID=2728847 RepID=UPI001E5DB661|nr:hypothetical protein [Chryseobacterium antibioticum]